MTGGILFIREDFLDGLNDRAGEWTGWRIESGDHVSFGIGQEFLEVPVDLSLKLIVRLFG